MVDYAKLLYLNPVQAVSNGIYTTKDMASFWTAASTVTKSNFSITSASAVNQIKPSQFFAMNFASPDIDVIEIQRSIDNLSSSQNKIYVPNVYISGVIQSSNSIVFFDAPSGVEIKHLSQGCFARLLFPTGRTRTVEITSLTRTSGNDLIVSVKENDILADNPLTFDRVNNVVLQGIFVTDPYRIMQVAASRDTTSNLNYAIPVQDFNAALYRLLYPSAQGMTADDAYADYLAFKSSRIGSTSEIATVSVAMRESVPSLTVSGEASIGFLRLGGGNVPPVNGISRDFVSEYMYCNDEMLVTERAIKTYSDRIRHMTMCNGLCLYDFVCNSNMTILKNLNSSNCMTSNLTCTSARARNVDIDHFVSNNSFSTYGTVTFGKSGTFQCDCDADFRSNVKLNSVDIQSGSIRSMNAKDCKVENLTCVDLASFSNGARFQSDIVGTDVSCDRVFAEHITVKSNVTGPFAFFQNFRCDDVTASDNVTTDKLIGDIVTTNKAIMSNARCSNLITDACAAYSIESTSVSANSIRANACSLSNLMCAKADVKQLATDSAGLKNANIDHARMETSYTSVADVGVMTVQGTLDVKGFFRFPFDTYFENSNVSTGKLIVQESADVANLNANKTKSSLLTIRKHTGTQRTKERKSSLFSFGDLMGIDKSRIGKNDTDYDNECLRIVVESMQNLVKNFSPQFS